MKPAVFGREMQGISPSRSQIAPFYSVGSAIFDRVYYIIQAIQSKGIAWQILI
jgi:hypothetical protein